MQSLLGNLRLAHKFLLIGAIAMVMAALPTAMAVRGELSVWQAARGETQGIPAAGAALKLVQLTQQHRGLSANVLAGNDSVKDARAQRQADVDAAFARLDLALTDLNAPALGNRNRELVEQWKALAADVSAKSIPGPQSFVRHTALIAGQLALIEEVNDASGMSLDPNADTYFLIQSVLVHLPRLTETLGQARAQGSLILSRGEIGSDQRSGLSALTNMSRSHMAQARRSLDKALTANPALRAAIAPKADAAWAAADAAAALVDKEILKADQLTMTPNAFFAASTAQIDAQFALIDEAFKVLAQELDNEAGHAMQRLVQLSAGIGVMVVLGGLLMLAIARQTTRAIAQAVKVAETVASGDLTSQIEVRNTDETGQLLTALRAMNQSLVTMVSAVRQSSESIATGSAQIATGNADLSSRTETQASNLEETAASMEQITSTVQQNAETSREAARIAREAKLAAEEGGQVVGRVVQTMQGINSNKGFTHKDMVHQNRIGLNGRDNGPRISQAAGFQHDALQALPIRGFPTALIAQPPQRIDQILPARAATAPTGQKRQARCRCKQHIVNTRLSGFVHDHMHGAKAAHMQLMPQPGCLARAKVSPQHR